MLTEDSSIVPCVGSGVCQNLPCGCIESAPGSPCDRLSGDQFVRTFLRIRNRDVDVLAIACGSPLNPAERSGGTNHGVPDDCARAGIERPIDSGLLPKS